MNAAAVDTISRGTTRARDQTAAAAAAPFAQAVRAATTDWLAAVKPLFRGGRWSLAQARADETVNAVRASTERLALQLVDAYVASLVAARRRAWLGGTAAMATAEELLLPNELREAEFDPAKHPREPAGSPTGGQFAATGGETLPTVAPSDRFYHGTSVNAARSLFKSQQFDLEKFGTGADRNFVRGKVGVFGIGQGAGFFGKGIYLTSAPELAQIYAQARPTGKGSVIAVTVTKPLLDGTDKSALADAVKQWWIDKTAAARQAKNLPAKPTEWLRKYYDDTVGQSYLDWTGAVSGFAKAKGFPGIKLSNSEIVIWDTKAIGALKKHSEYREAGFDSPSFDAGDLLARIDAVVAAHVPESVRPLVRSLEFAPLGAVHGEYEGGVVTVDPRIADSAETFGTPPRQIDQLTRTVLHEWGHALGHASGADRSSEWLGLSGWRHAPLREAEWDEEKHPRAPAGSPVGGQFADAGNGQEYSKVTKDQLVDGRAVRDHIPNQDSIDASLTDYKILPGIREVPLNAFDPAYVQAVRARSPDVDVQRLSAAIEQSKEINPLIVAIDDKGPYILEGGHRFDALITLKAKSLPALIVVDLESAGEDPKNWKWSYSEMPDKREADHAAECRYVEERPGWEPGPSPWMHAEGAWFPRSYSAKSPADDFADCCLWAWAGWESEFGEPGAAKLDYVRRAVTGMVEAGFDPEKHPREPAGAPTGGQFAVAGGGAGLSRGDDKVWRDAAGKAAPKSVQERLGALRVPPAWTDVRVNADAEADLQVVGRDTKGRAQYLYSAAHSERAAAEKFARLKEFDAQLTGLRGRIAADFDSADIPAVEREAAAVLTLIDRTGFRIGSHAETGAASKAYGASTLRAEHVSIRGDSVTFRFTGKKGVAIEKTLADRQLAALLRPRVKAGGALFSVSDGQVRDYLRSRDGAFKVKDLRTWHGTNAALKEIARRLAPKSEKEFSRAQREVAKVVAAHLGNTPAVSLKSYIDPAVFSAWRAAILAKADN